MYVDETFWRWSQVYLVSLAMMSGGFALWGTARGAGPYVLAAWVLWLNPTTGMRPPTFIDTVRWIVAMPLGLLALWGSWYTPGLTEVLVVLTLLAREYPLGGTDDTQQWLLRLWLAVRQVLTAVSVAAYAVGLMYYAQTWHDAALWKTYALMASVAWLDRLAVRPWLRAQLPEDRRCSVLYLHLWLALPWYTVLYSLPNALNVFVLHALAPDTWNGGRDERVDAALWVQNLALGTGVGVGHLIWRNQLVEGRTEYYGVEDFLVRVLVSVLFSFYFVATSKSVEDQHHGGDGDEEEEVDPEASVPYYVPPVLHCGLLVPSVWVASCHTSALGFLAISAML